MFNARTAGVHFRNAVASGDARVVRLAAGLAALHRQDLPAQDCDLIPRSIESLVFPLKIQASTSQSPGSASGSVLGTVNRRWLRFYLTATEAGACHAVSGGG